MKNNKSGHSQTKKPIKKLKLIKLNTTQPKAKGFKFNLTTCAPPYVIITMIPKTFNGLAC
jgi:hypothetical protein